MQREQLLVKVRADSRDPRAGARGRQRCSVRRVVDVAPDAARHRGDRRRRQGGGACCACSSPYGIKELAQSGTARHRARPVERITERRHPRCHRGSGRAPVEQTAEQTAKTPPTKEKHTVAEIFYDDDADLSLIQGKKVAVIGYGSQGHAHALNLRDSGVDVRDRPQAGLRSRAEGEEAGAFECSAPAEAAEWADVIVILAPDQHQRGLLRRRHQGQPRRRATRSSSATASTSASATSSAPEGVDVDHGRPEGPGHLVRREYVGGRGVPVHRRRRAGRDGQRLGRSRWSYAKAHRRPARRRHQDHLHRGDRDRPVRRAGRAAAAAPRSWSCTASRRSSRRATSPRSRTSRCLHELKLIVDLMWEGGIAKQRWSVSDTAEYGDYVSGPRVIDARREGEHAGRARRHPVRRVRRALHRRPGHRRAGVHRAPREGRGAPDRGRPARSCAPSSPGSSRTPTT